MKKPKIKRSTSSQRRSYWAAAALGWFLPTLPLAAENLTCQNCDAYVEVWDLHANDLIESLRMLGSMPLDGEVVQWRPGAGRSRVHVVTLPEYAVAHQVSTFDVANKVLALAKARPEWGIESIFATYQSLETNNVGTIGH